MIDYRHAPIDYLIRMSSAMLYRTPLFYVQWGEYDFNKKQYCLRLNCYMDYDAGLDLVFKKRKDWEKFIRDFVILQHELENRDDIKAYYQVAHNEYTLTRYDPFNFILYSFWDVNEIIMAFPDQESAYQYFKKVNQERLVFAKEYQYD